MAATIPGTAMMAMLCFVALALPADAYIRGRNCTGVHVAGKDFLNNTHLRIGLSVNKVTVECDANARTGNTNPCALYGTITQEDNNNGEHTKFKVWTGFDIDLIEELARLGNFSYTIVSMGNGSNTKDFDILARVMLGLDDPSPENLRRAMTNYDTGTVPGPPVDVIGQGDWQHDKLRQDWAIWTSPVLTSDVLLLTKPPVYTRAEPSPSMLFDPFTWKVWVCLVAGAIFMSGLFYKTRKNYMKTKAEVAPISFIYTTFGQFCGLGGVEFDKTSQRGITFGWIMFCMVAMQFWSAGLTAQLVVGGDFTDVKTWRELQLAEDGEKLCVEDGSANAGYFNRSTNASLGGAHKYTVEGIPSKLEMFAATMDGTCTGSEVTREDYNAQKSNKNKAHQCKTVTAAQPIARRPRGMMSRTNKSCIITGIDALIHEYGTEECDPETTRRGHMCNLFFLWTHHYPEPECKKPAKDGDEAAAAMGLEIFIWPFVILLVIVTVVGAVLTTLGRGESRLNSWPIRLFVKSPEGRKAALKDHLGDQYPAYKKRRDTADPVASSASTSDSQQQQQKQPVGHSQQPQPAAAVAPVAAAAAVAPIQSAPALVSADTTTAAQTEKKIGDLGPRTETYIDAQNHESIDDRAAAAAAEKPHQKPHSIFGI